MMNIIGWILVIAFAVAFFAFCAVVIWYLVRLYRQDKMLQQMQNWGKNRKRKFKRALRNARLRKGAIKQGKGWV